MPGEGPRRRDSRAPRSWRRASPPARRPASGMPGRRPVGGRSSSRPSRLPGPWDEGRSAPPGSLTAARDAFTKRRWSPAVLTFPSVSVSARPLGPCARVGPRQVTVRVENTIGALGVGSRVEKGARPRADRGVPIVTDTVGEYPSGELRPEPGKDRLDRQARKCGIRRTDEFTNSMTVGFGPTSRVLIGDGRKLAR